MPSDSHVSRLKHRHSSPADEDAEKSSKRHKHRHHRSKKDAEEIGPPPPPPPPAVITGNDDDVEEGEIIEEDKVVELRHVDSDSPSLEVQVGNSSNGFVEKFISDSKDGKVHTNLVAFENGALSYGCNDDDERHERSTCKKTSYPDDDSVDGDSIKLIEQNRKSSFKRDNDKSKIVEHSRSHKIFSEEVYTRRRSVSCDGSGERSYSQSRDLLRDVEQERNGGYSRYFKAEDKREKERARDGETDRNLRRDGHREKSKERGQRESRGCDRRREADRDLSRDRGIGRDHRRERERERSWDMELQRDWRRENDRGSRDWEADRNWRQDRDRERSRDWELEREHLRVKERERSKEREESDKYRQRDRDRSKDIYRARSSERDREREKYSDIYRHRFRDGDHDWESQKERERKNDRNRDNDRDRKTDSEKVQISHSDSAVARKKTSRDEDEQDDFEEKISLKLAEQEEEDLERIKEESRRRRQAILEKYKKKQLQEQANQSKDEECGQQPTEAAQFSKVASESPDGVDAAVADPLFSVGKSPAENGVQALQKVSGAAGLGEGTPKSERSNDNDKYCDDIFGEMPSGIRKMDKEDGFPVTGDGFHDNWDDLEGYYSYRFGEVLDGRYEVAAGHGKGVFSTVVRAKDLKAGLGDPEEVAIKIIRNNETMNKAGKEEVQILRKLAALDPENKRHCVRFVSCFKYRNHLCLVFESLHMNLREVLKKFGHNIGLKLTAVRAYAKQLFIALKHLKNSGVLHCDIKPDNMLVNEAKNVLKLCDFGNAMSAGKNEITPYLVSRFYRAPEIILGLSYDHPMDMWSVGCCLYELYTGKVLFPGATNNDMLRLHMELKGSFPKKMLKKGAFVDQHFDQDLNFLATEEDPVTKKTVKRMLANIKPKDIGSIIKGSPGEDPKMLANFKDLLDKIFVLDPEKRMTVQQALSHPFITGK